MSTYVSCVPHVFVSRVLQCISHASQKHHPLWSYVPTVLPRGKCGCSLGSADLYERWNSTNHQEHETAPKKQLVDHGSLSQQNKLARIDRAHLPQRVHEPKLTLMHELGKRNVHDKKTSAQAKERYRNPQKLPTMSTRNVRMCSKASLRLCKKILSNGSEHNHRRATLGTRSLLTNEEKLYQHMESIKPEKTSEDLSVTVWRSLCKTGEKPWLMKSKLRDSWCRVRLQTAIGRINWSISSIPRFLPSYVLTKLLGC